MSLRQINCRDKGTRSLLILANNSDATGNDITGSQASQEKGKLEAESGSRIYYSVETENEHSGYQALRFLDSHVSAVTQLSGDLRALSIKPDRPDISLHPKFHPSSSHFLHNRINISNIR